MGHEDTTPAFNPAAHLPRQQRGGLMGQRRGEGPEVSLRPGHSVGGLQMTLWVRSSPHAAMPRDDTVLNWHARLARAML